MNAGLNFLIYRISEGDPQAFRKMFEEYSPKVYAFALKLTHSSTMAEEMVQDVFMKIWLNRKSLCGIDHFPAYLYAMTRNMALNILKRMALEEKAKRSIAQETSGTHSHTEEEIIYTDYHHLLSRAIEGLPPQQKLVYSLCHGEGLKYEEVAQKLRISRLTVKTHMQQALRNIKSHFKILIKILIPWALAILQ
jgi:RNA polymerase sigma-70 factor (ECF subfamily)